MEKLWPHCSHPQCCFSHTISSSFQEVKVTMLGKVIGQKVEQEGARARTPITWDVWCGILTQNCGLSNEGGFPILLRHNQICKDLRQFKVPGARCASLGTVFHLKFLQAFFPDKFCVENEKLWWLTGNLLPKFQGDIVCVIIRVRGTVGKSPMFVISGSQCYWNVMPCVRSPPLKFLWLDHCSWIFPLSSRHEV